MRYAEAMDSIADTIRRAKTGDDAAFAEFVQRTIDGSYRFARSLGANGEDAEDAVQEAYVRAWRALGKFDVTKPVTPWLYQIVKRSLFDLYRKNRREVVSLDDSNDADYAHALADPEPLPDAIFEQEESRALMRTALSGLPARDQTVLSLRYDESFSFEEIALALEIPAATVRSIHHRALTKLRERLTGLV